MSMNTMEIVISFVLFILIHSISFIFIMINSDCKPAAMCDLLKVIIYYIYI